MQEAEFIAAFHLPPRYTVTRAVGKGSFGTLVAAQDSVTGKTVAIKKVEGGSGGLGTDLHESKKLLREMRLLQHFQHENIMSLHDIMVPCGEGAAGTMAAAASGSGEGSGSGSGSSVSVGWRQTFYLVQDLMDTDLHRVIQNAAKGRQQITDNHVRCFAYQTLRGIYACHSAQVLHRDLKPSNLLVNKDCTLRIGDFGLARGVSDVPNDDNRLTEYVVVRPSVVDAKPPPRSRIPSDTSPCSPICTRLAARRRPAGTVPQNSSALATPTAQRSTCGPVAAFLPKCSVVPLSSQGATCSASCA
jgi:serine/threonine protein kinase